MTDAREKQLADELAAILSQPEPDIFTSEDTPMISGRSGNMEGPKFPIEITDAAPKPQPEPHMNPADCSCEHIHCSSSSCPSVEPSQGAIKESDRLFPAAINPLRARQAQPEPPRDTLQEARELYRKVSSQSPPEGIARSASAEVAESSGSPLETILRLAQPWNTTEAIQVISEVVADAAPKPKCCLSATEGGKSTLCRAGVSYSFF